MNNKERDIWIDNIKILACILVVLGHFFQSMVKANILPENALYHWFNETIYYFHVPLFFICSGYLYQKYTKMDRFTDWTNHIVKKLVVLGIPYVVFTIITWALKKLFAEAVNESLGGLTESLFVRPTAPFWYLYALFLLFCIIPVFKTKKLAVTALTVFVLLKFLQIGGVLNGKVLRIPAATYIADNGFWFIAGMFLAVSGFEGMCSVRDNHGKKAGNAFLLGGAIIFSLLSVCIQVYDVRYGYLNFFMGVFGCGIFVFAVQKIQIGSWQAKYVFPVFLMHTLCAAPIRVFLVHLNIRNVVVHVLAGIIFSFMGPVFIVKVMEKVKPLDFVVYPKRYIEFSFIRKRSRENG